MNLEVIQETAPEERLRSGEHGTRYPEKADCPDDDGRIVDGGGLFVPSRGLLDHAARAHA